MKSTTAPDTEDELVYLADSSWFEFPGGGTRYHFDIDGRSACGKAPILNETTAMPTSRVVPVLRCGANGCRQRWDRVDPS